MDRDLQDALQRLWGNDRPPLSMLGAAAAEGMEARYGLSLPQDFADYLGEASPSEDWMDDTGMTWWATGRVTSLRDECGSETPSDQRNAEIEAEAHAYLVFADFLFWCYAYAICCSDGPNRGKVAIIGATPDRFVASSFTAFVDLAAADSKRIHPGGLQETP